MSQTDRQEKPVGFYGPTAPPGPYAYSLECPPNVVPSCEFRTCPDPEFQNALHSEFMNTPNVEFLNVPLCSAPYMSYLAGSKWSRRCVTGTLQRVGACSIVGVSHPYLRYSNRGRLQNVSPPSVSFELSRIFFTRHRGHRRRR